jgi:hypothetical protein
LVLKRADGRATQRSPGSPWQAIQIIGGWHARRKSESPSRRDISYGRIAFFYLVHSRSFAGKTFLALKLKLPPF